MVSRENELLSSPVHSDRSDGLTCYFPFIFSDGCKQRSIRAVQDINRYVFEASNTEKRTYSPEFKPSQSLKRGKYDVRVFDNDIEDINEELKLLKFSNPSYDR